MLYLFLCYACLLSLLRDITKLCVFSILCFILCLFLLFMLSSLLLSASLCLSAIPISLSHTKFQSFLCMFPLTLFSLPLSPVYATLSFLSASLCLYAIPISQSHTKFQSFLCTFSVLRCFVYVFLLSTLYPLSSLSLSLLCSFLSSTHYIISASQTGYVRQEVNRLTAKRKLKSCTNTRSSTHATVLRRA